MKKFSIELWPHLQGMKTAEKVQYFFQACQATKMLWEVLVNWVLWFSSVWTRNHSHTLLKQRRHQFLRNDRIFWASVETFLPFMFCQNFRNGNLLIQVAFYGILSLKLFWPDLLSMRKRCCSDRENFLRSLEQFVRAVKGQNNFW